MLQGGGEGCQGHRGPGPSAHLGSQLPPPTDSPCAGLSGATLPEMRLVRVCAGPRWGVLVSADQGQLEPTPHTSIHLPDAARSLEVSGCIHQLKSGWLPALSVECLVLPNLSLLFRALGTFQETAAKRLGAQVQ